MTDLTPGDIISAYLAGFRGNCTTRPTQAAEHLIEEIVRNGFLIVKAERGLTLRVEKKAPLTSITQRAARALAAKFWESTRPNDGPMPDEHFAHIWNDPAVRAEVIACVHAMVTAIREPSSDMLDTAENVWARCDDPEDDCGLHETIPQTVFKAMIDTILAEKDGE